MHRGELGALGSRAYLQSTAVRPGLLPHGHYPTDIVAAAPGTGDEAQIQRIWWANVQAYGAATIGSSCGVSGGKQPAGRWSS